VNIGFHHEGIGTYTLACFAVKVLAGTDDCMVEFCNGFRFELTERVTNASPSETIRIVPISDAQNAAKRPMVLDLILQLVIIVVAAKSNGGQHNHLPIVHPWSSDITPRVSVEILGDKLDDFLSEIAIGIKMLESNQDRDDFVTTFQIERDFCDRATIKSPLR
jgi:hypothetical protein